MKIDEKLALTVAGAVIIACTANELVVRPQLEKMKAKSKLSKN